MSDKPKAGFPVIILLCVFLFILIYHYSYLFPFTNNAFVVANVRPVAANVKGYITNIYVKNEQEVKKANHYLPYSKPPMNWPTGKL